MGHVTRCFTAFPPIRSAARRAAVAVLVALLVLPFVAGVGTAQVAPPDPQAAPGAVLSIDPSLAHEGDPVTVVAPGCTDQVRFVVTAASGATVLDQTLPAGSYRVVFTVPVGSAGTTLAVDATCLAADGSTSFTYQSGNVSVVGAGADATISADPTTLDPGATTSISGTRCVLGGVPGIVDISGLGSLVSFPAGADGSWRVDLTAPPTTPPGSATITTRCRAANGPAEFGYADLQLTIRSGGGTLGPGGGGITGNGNPVPTTGGTASPITTATAATTSPGLPATSTGVGGGGSSAVVASAPATPVGAVASYVG